MTLERTHLACFATLPDGHGFENTVAAAARAGFDELAIWLMSLEQARQELGSLEAVKDCLDRYGVRVTVLELLHAWAGADDAACEEELAVMQAFVEVFDPEVVLAASLAPAIAPGGLGWLKRQCQALAPCKVALEFLPFGAVKDLATALEMLADINEDNLGLVFDSWHFARAGQDYELLEQVPGEKIHFIQLNDAAREPWGNPVDETLRGRLRPGEGAVDWPRLIAILEGKNLSCGVGSEQYSDAVKAMDLDQACRYLFDSIQDILADPHHKPL
jgi:sugar phosphate isomerase/epimerase